MMNWTILLTGAFGVNELAVALTLVFAVSLQHFTDIPGQRRAIQPVPVPVTRSAAHRRRP